jgi:hypothetical protein
MIVQHQMQHMITKAPSMSSRYRLLWSGKRKNTATVPRMPLESTTTISRPLNVGVTRSVRFSNSRSAMYRVYASWTMPVRISDDAKRFVIETWNCTTASGGDTTE